MSYYVVCQIFFKYHPSDREVEKKRHDSDFLFEDDQTGKATVLLANFCRWKRNYLADETERFSVKSYRSSDIIKANISRGVLRFFSAPAF